MTGAVTPSGIGTGSGAAPARRRSARRKIDSLAVLPLENASQDPEMEYLSDGITEAVINTLSQLPRLRVMARSTVFRYKGPAQGPQAIGRDLSVRAVLTGRVMQRGDMLVIGTELVDVDDGSQIWGGQFNRRLSGIFELQEEISSEITDKLKLTLTGDQRRDWRNGQPGSGRVRPQLHRFPTEDVPSVTAGPRYSCARVSPPRRAASPTAGRWAGSSARPARAGT